MVERTVILQSDNHYGHSVPPESFGNMLATVGRAACQSVVLATQGRSAISGKPPRWLAEMWKFRYTGFTGDDETVLCFEAPTFKEAAPELLSQKEMWPECERPSPDATAFDLLGDVFVEATQASAENWRFDKTLTRTFKNFEKPLTKDFCRIVVPVSLRPASSIAAVDLSTIDRIHSFWKRIPDPKRVKVAGKLDMVRASTRTFELELEEGLRLRGVLTTGRMQELTSFFEKRILVEALAVYGPTGKVIRLDADHFEDGADVSAAFSKAPKAHPRRASLSAVFQAQKHKRGLSAVIGKWPGDESDEEIEAALKELA